jgi:hypothetical protein
MSLAQVASRKQLRELQKIFFAIITRPLAPRSRMKAAPRARELIRPSPTLTPHERLELYAQQYWWRVLDSLRDDFPGVRFLLGERRFERMLVRYVQAHPSRTFTLRNLGSTMERFLRRDRALPKRVRESAADVAAIEWCQICSYDAAALPSLTTELLQKHGAALKLCLQPHVQFLKVSHSVDVFLGNTRQLTSRDDASNVRAPRGLARTRLRVRKSLRRAPTAVATHRVGFRVRIESLELEEVALLKELQRGGTLAQLFKRLLQKKSKLNPEGVQRAFKHFTTLGWIAVPTKKRSSNAQKDSSLH